MKHLREDFRPQLCIQNKVSGFKKASLRYLEHSFTGHLIFLWAQESMLSVLTFLRKYYFLTPGCSCGFWGYYNLGYFTNFKGPERSTSTAEGTTEPRAGRGGNLPRSHRNKGVEVETATPGSKSPAASMKLSTMHKGVCIWPLQAHSFPVHPSDGMRKGKLGGRKDMGHLGMWVTRGSWTHSICYSRSPKPSHSPLPISFSKSGLQTGLIQEAYQASLAYSQPFIASQPPTDSPCDICLRTQVTDSWSKNGDAKTYFLGGLWDSLR